MTSANITPAIAPSTTPIIVLLFKLPEPGLELPAPGVARFVEVSVEASLELSIEEIPDDGVVRSGVDRFVVASVGGDVDDLEVVVGVDRFVVVSVGGDVDDIEVVVGVARFVEVSAEGFVNSVEAALGSTDAAPLMIEEQIVAISPVLRNDFQQFLKQKY
jgi:hypothetical protein